jgi:hypothetical protein
MFFRAIGQMIGESAAKEVMNDMVSSGRFDRIVERAAAETVVKELTKALRTIPPLDFRRQSIKKRIQHCQIRIQEIDQLEQEIKDKEKQKKHQKIWYFMFFAIAFILIIFSLIDLFYIFK